jgi:hypothetical protein
MSITMVKKILEDGTECKKCQEVSERMEINDEMRHIDRVVYADVRDEKSEGYKIATRYGLDIAPFFIVDEDGREVIYKTYLELKRKVFNKEPDPEDIEIEEKRKSDPDEDLYYL